MVTFALARLRFSSPLFVALLLAAFAGGMTVSPDGLEAAPVSYIAGVEDLPLMPGLTERTDERVIFDTPAGRIVEATTVGDMAAPAVVAFYESTLPQLGWRPAGRLNFEREGERLSIEFRKAPAAAGRLVVRFTLKPLSPP